MLWEDSDVIKQPLTITHLYFLLQFLVLWKQDTVEHSFDFCQKKVGLGRGDKENKKKIVLAAQDDWKTAGDLLAS